MVPNLSTANRMVRHWNCLKVTIHAAVDRCMQVIPIVAAAILL
jgi:hypothetical protein